jgi:hypothetical protein
MAGSAGSRSISGNLINNEFYVGVNLGVLNLFPFELAHLGHNKSELQSILKVR